MSIRVTARSTSGDEEAKPDGDALKDVKVETSR